MDIIIEEGDRVFARKKHPCGANVFTVVRTGADYKLKCEGCGKALFLSKDEVKKMAKKIVKKGEEN